MPGSTATGSFAFGDIGLDVEALLLLLLSPGIEKQRNFAATYEIDFILKRPETAQVP